MNRALLLRLHRWASLVFALPLLVVVGTGLILSFEPIAHHAAVRPGSLTTARVLPLLTRHDPQAQARAINLRPYDNLLVLSGARPGPPVAVDLSTGEEVQAEDGIAWSDLFVTSRQLHETLLLDLGWLVVASSFAMLALALLGVSMGWPRPRHTVAGWHKGVAWGLLPFVVLSPLTGLAIALGVTFISAAAPQDVGSGGPLGLADAVRVVGASGHDLSGLVWLRQQGGRTLVRLDEGGEWRLYALTRGTGPVLQPRNWPRLLHEGNFAPSWPGLLNALTSLALLGLIGTGLFLWARRKVRRRPTGANRVPRAANTSARA